jgi:uncharacterized protein (TIGR02271 family)
LDTQMNEGLMSDGDYATGDDLVSAAEAANPPAGDADPRGWGVVAGDGTWLGNVADLHLDRASGEPRYLEVLLEPSIARQPGGRRVFVAADTARLDATARRVHLDAVEGLAAHLLPVRPGAEATAAPSPYHGASSSAAAAPVAVEGEVRMQLSEEELEIGRRVVEAGEVRVRKHVETQQVREVVPVMREDVTVERRPLPEGAGLEPRQEGDTWFIPIVQEELVIQKRLVAREELVIRKRQVMGEQVVEETIRRETPEVLAPGETGLDEPER